MQRLGEVHVSAGTPHGWCRYEITSGQRVHGAPSFSAENYLHVQMGPRYLNGLQRQEIGYLKKFVEAQLMQNAVLISAVQQSDSVIYTCILLHILFYYDLLTSQDIEYISLCYTTVLLSPRVCPTLSHPTDCSTPGFPVLHYLPELAQTHVH